MALRDKLRERALPHLEPGEQLVSVLPATSGVNPALFAVVGGLLMLLLNRNLVLVRTDRAVVVLTAGKLSAYGVKGVDRRLPVTTTLALDKGTVWGKSTTILDKPLYVHRRFWGDADAFDAATAGAAAAPTGTPAGWYPDPDDAGQQRYWDGQAWTEHRTPAG